MDTTIKKPDKQSLCYLAIVLAIAVLVVIGLVYYLYQKPEIEEGQPVEKTLEEIIRELTTARGEAEPLSEEVIKDLTSPRKGEKPIPLSEEVIKELTAPKQ